VLSQLFEEPDYMATFKYLQEKESHDGMDIYYDYLWDINIMEYLIRILSINCSSNLFSVFLRKQNSLVIFMEVVGLRMNQARFVQICVFLCLLLSKSSFEYGYCCQHL